MLRIKNVKISITNDDLLGKIAHLLKIKVNEIKNIKISKLSIDAREKNNIMYVYEVDVDVLNENKIQNELDFLYIEKNKEAKK